MSENRWKLGLGAELLDNDKAYFKVWAPKAGKVALRLFSPGSERSIDLAAGEDGYFTTEVEKVSAGDSYLYLLDGHTERPDPVSRFQPQGVHGPSMIVDPRQFPWQDQGWQGIPLEAYVIYELHVGVFSDDGTFTAAIPHLDYLKDLGVTAVEIMPVAQFPGNRNWGYDGVYPFAPQSSYGGPEGLRELVDACHGKGLAVILDVVYNHFGPEGNYLNDYGYYFTDRYRTPWGDAINFDGPHSDQVREYFIANALYWIHEYHFDALRLDAIDRIYDLGATHFLRALADEVHRHGQQLGRRIYLIAESDLNDVRLINPPETGGYGVDAQWNDNFHHALHALLTGEKEGYYQDFGRFDHLVKAFTEGYVYSGEYSRYRKKRHGNSAKNCPTVQFVAFSQNHDQVGNRLHGDRLAAKLPLQKLLLAAGTVLLSPYLPLLFMGEEYGEKAPFNYFVSYGDSFLIEAVRKGRKEEFAAFAWAEEALDPQDPDTFMQSKLDLKVRQGGEHAALFACYKKLLSLRREVPALGCVERREMTVIPFEEKQVLALTRRVGNSSALCAWNYSDTPQDVAVELDNGKWQKLFDSAATQWGGAGEMAYSTLTATEGRVRIALTPWSFTVYLREE
ncbi:maltooligosyltrehalose trehalohydrolase, putative [Geotalea daltonii FRC-32]|uniref:Malto-oligosyltrehalose trehalohydrolase n=1 Tax=Geotalea daltonii (strain DSM 22248 / JCM 15807 / FRC-32) TaxID=316067 RepID=B9M3T2_GEODF|nr:malto-oligosyltrehalose trehalohydrolase [Geotalea daltonii]ACM19575.1 maltooligosyltrehalose trehalohydrolase, putative [Geotalea daltonii FRC-32]